MTFILQLLNIEIPGWTNVLLSFLLALIITYVSIPSIITVARNKGLYDKPNGRGSHNGNIPTLGGVAIFAGFMISASIFVLPDIFKEFKFIIAALILLFFTGIKDDILVMDPKKKLFAQIGAAGMITILGNIRITSFHGFAAINELSYIISVIFSIFVIIVIINGFNLIDGINGLASGVAILTSVTFGVWFFLVDEISYCIFSFALAGALIAFFRYNVFSKENKIFLGDTGSLSVGLIISMLAIHFLEFDFPGKTDYNFEATPAITFGILIVPLFDTLRVFIIRIFGGDSPFKADKKHIHHRLIDLGCGHFRASVIIMSVNLLFILMVFLLKDLGNLKLLIILLASAAGLSYIPVYLLNRGKKMQEDVQKSNY